MKINYTRVFPVVTVDLSAVRTVFYLFIYGRSAAQWTLKVKLNGSGVMLSAEPVPLLNSQRGFAIVHMSTST